MAGAHTLEFTDENFEQEVLQSDMPVLVDFWAEWCAPCRMLAPTIDEIAEEYAGKVKVGKVNTDLSPKTPAQYGISAIPTVMVFKDGQAVKKMVGIQPKRGLAAALDEVLGSSS